MRLLTKAGIESETEPVQALNMKMDEVDFGEMLGLEASRKKSTPKKGETKVEAHKISTPDSKNDGPFVWKTMENAHGIAMHTEVQLTANCVHLGCRGVHSLGGDKVVAVYRGTDASLERCAGYRQFRQQGGGREGLRRCSLALAHDL